MRFKILAAAILILLGITIFSVYSGSNNKSTQDDKDIIQQTEVVNNSSFLDFSKDWNGFKAVVVNNDKLRKATANESAEKYMSVADENNIFKEIKLDNSSIKAPESCSEFETLIVNSSEFIELASNGTVNLSLMGEDYELKLQEREIQKPNVNSYMGYIVGKPQSSAFFTVKNDSIDGCINVDFFNQSYGIASTDEKYDGKTVHLLWRYYNEGGEEKFRKHYSLDPLEFSLRNSDDRSHEIHIELFDFYNKSVFKENYTMNTEDKIFSPEINVEPGYYRYEIILDNKSTFEQRVTANYATNLGGSEKLHLNIRDDPDNPIEFTSEIA
jgi:Reprolysin family propeptide.